MASVALLLLQGLGPSAVAQADGHGHDHGGEFPALTIAALEGEDCPGGETFCFQVVEGSLDGIAPDTSVQITLENRGQAVHNLAIAEAGDADPTHEDTPPGERIAGSADEIQPGDQETFVFHVPASAEGLYLWCHVPGHEQLGMWLTVTLASGPAGGDEPVEDDEGGHHHGGVATYPFGSTVEASDDDFGWPSHAAGSGDVCLLDDDGDGAYDPGEPIYLFATAAHGHGGDDDDDHDEEECGKIPGDAIRLLAPDGFAPGSLVKASDADFAKPTSEIHAHPRYFDSDGDEEFEPPDAIYLDLTGGHSVTVGDLRLTAYLNLPPGSVVVNGDPDLTNGLTALAGDDHLSFHDDDVIFEGGDEDQWYLNVEGEHDAVAHNDVRLTNAIPDIASTGGDTGTLAGQLAAMEEAQHAEMDEMEHRVDEIYQDLDLMRTDLTSGVADLDGLLERLDGIEQRLDLLEEQMGQGASDFAQDEDGVATSQVQPTPAPPLALVLAALAVVGLLAVRRRERRDR